MVAAFSFLSDARLRAAYVLVGCALLQYALRRVLLSSVALALLSVFCAAPAAAQEGTAFTLLNAPPPPKSMQLQKRAAPAFRDARVRRQRTARLHPQLFRSTASPFVRRQPGDRLQLNLFEDARLTGVAQSVIGRGAAVTLTAELEGGGRAVLATREGVLSGTVRDAHDRLFRIVPAGGGAYTVREMKPDLVGHCPAAPTPALRKRGARALPLRRTPPERHQAPAQDVAASSTERLDLLVVYSPAARAGAGGTAALQADIDVAVARLNESLASSAIDVQARLAHTAELAYEETGDAQTDLQNITFSEDGVLDEVHALRDAHGADLVSLIVEEMGGATIGLAWVTRNINAVMDQFAFSVIQRPYLASTSVFAHELGHNLGAAHEPNSGSTGFDEASHAHRLQVDGQTRRTVMWSRMSYHGFPHFSNPAVRHAGVPTGEAGLAANAATIQEIAAYAAGYREAALPVELAAFTGVSDAGSVLLRWQTASEMNNEGFEVLHAVEGGYEQVGYRAGAGTTTAAQHYALRVQGLAPGVHTFRLRQVDADGTHTLSDPARVTLKLPGHFALSAPAPNPAARRAHLQLSVNQTQTVRADVFDALGRHVRVLHNGPAEAGEPLRLTLNGTRLASGLYFVRVSGERFLATRRLTLVK